jgi:hypothetical protein
LEKIVDSNGTRVDEIESISTGVVDAVVPYLHPVDADMMNSVLYTHPIQLGYDDYALMTRQASTFDVNTSSLLAGIHPFVYMLFAASLCLLCLIAWLNERRHSLQNDRFVNYLWNIIHSLIPSNSPEWAYQFGVTRKMLSITFGVALLLSTAYYQSNLLQQLMIQTLPSIPTIVDITNKIKAHKFTVMFLTANSSTEWNIRTSTATEMKDFASALKINPPISVINIEDDAEDGIFIGSLSDIYMLLSQNEGDDCSELVLFKFSSYAKHYMSIMLNRQRGKQLELLNGHIAARMDFISNLRSKYTPDAKCLSELNATPSLQYNRMKLFSLSGCFAFLLVLLLCCAISFLVEVVVFILHNTYASSTKDEISIRDITLNLNDYKTEHHHHVIAAYEELLKRIEYYKN